MIEKNERLKIGGVDAEELAERYGTPAYIYDKQKIQEQYRRLVEAFEYDNFQVSYAVKANSNPSVVEALVEQGAGLDCASRAELMLADRVDADDIIYTAPFNTEEELEFARRLADAVNLDAVSLLDKMDEMPEVLSFRIDPGVGRGDFGLVLGGNTKFGVPKERAVEAYSKAKKRGVESFGIHMMTGSNITDEEYFAEITEKLLEMAGEISDELGVEFEFVDIGGGLGIPYEPDDDRLDLEKAASETVRAYEEGVEKYGLGDPTLKIEPGRFLVAEAGVLLTRVTGVKQKSGKTYVGTDTGMHQMIRPMLYDAYHEILLANDLEREPESRKDVVGCVCENDYLARDREMPEIVEGDLLAVMNSGAYGFVMASNWNSRPLPPEIMVEKGSHEVVRQGQDPEDIFHGTKYGGMK